MVWGMDGLECLWSKGPPLPYWLWPAGIPRVHGWAMVCLYLPSLHPPRLRVGAHEHGEQLLASPQLQGLEDGRRQQVHCAGRGLIGRVRDRVGLGLTIMVMIMAKGRVGVRLRIRFTLEDGGRRRVHHAGRGFDWEDLLSEASGIPKQMGVRERRP